MGGCYGSISSLSSIRSSKEVIICSPRDRISAYAGSASHLSWISLRRALLSYSVYRHEILDLDAAGIFYTWAVRSVATGNPADLVGAE